MHCQCGCGGLTSIAKRSDATKGYVRGQHYRFLPSHSRRVTTPEQRVSHDPENGCWNWQRAKMANGYGQMYDKAQRRVRAAHRVYYENFKGPIPPHLKLDHLCRNRACVNPEHLEAVTNAENSRRGLRAKLSSEDVSTIRKEFASGGVTKVQLAREFGVHWNQIALILAGRSWRDDSERFKDACSLIPVLTDGQVKRLNEIIKAEIRRRDRERQAIVEEFDLVARS